MRLTEEGASLLLSLPLSLANLEMNETAMRRAVLVGRTVAVVGNVDNLRSDDQ